LIVFNVDVICLKIVASKFQLIEQFNILTVQIKETNMKWRWSL